MPLSAFIWVPFFSVQTMYSQLFFFCLSSLALLSLSRLGLCLWQYERVQAVNGWMPILWGGLRVDLHLIAALTAIPWLFAPWLDDAATAHRVLALYLSLGGMLIVLLEISTPQFILEYDTRPNRLYVDYLKHPKEVFGMLWKGYKGIVLGGSLLWLVISAANFYALTVVATPLTALHWPSALGCSLLSAIVLFGLIRGTWRHRPINPSTVAFCGDAMVNTLALNSLYSVLYAIYSIKNERSAEQAYGKMPADQMIHIIRKQAGIEQPASHPLLPTLHSSSPAQSHTQPKNIVLIVEESLGAQYIGNLGGSGLTPWIDYLSQEAWNFTRAYATGTRSVRGLEAISAGFPPTLSDAAVRLSGAQSRFFTLAQLLNQQGYVSRFIYGGEAHFDNMKSFFLGNGFTELHDQATFKNPAFTGTWGVSDEDMFNRLHTLLSQQKPTEPPSLNLAFSVSNHSPWEYPEGRITPIGEPASVENTVRYADWALGQFFAQARQSDYWDNTLFLVVADHDARVGGKSLVPLQHFHIPAMILGGGITPRRDDRLISQIDLPVTLLSLAGIQADHPMIGHDLTQPHAGGRAMMQYGENYGYLKDNCLTVLEPLREPSQWLYQAPHTYQPYPLDPELLQEALAHALWPHWAYQNGAHSLPELIKTTTLTPAVDPNDNPAHVSF